MVILTVSADDVDESRHNRNIDYSFGSGNDDGVFQIARWVQNDAKAQKNSNYARSNKRSEYTLKANQCRQ